MRAGTSLRELRSEGLLGAASRRCSSESWAQQRRLQRPPIAAALATLVIIRFYCPSLHAERRRGPARITTHRCQRLLAGPQAPSCQQARGQAPTEPGRCHAQHGGRKAPNNVPSNAMDMEQATEEPTRGMENQSPLHARRRIWGRSAERERKPRATSNSELNCCDSSGSTTAEIAAGAQGVHGQTEKRNAGARPLPPWLC